MSTAKAKPPKTGSSAPAKTATKTPAKTALDRPAGTLAETREKTLEATSAPAGGGGPAVNTPSDGATCAAALLDLAALSDILARYPHDETALIQILQDAHRAYNYLPADVLIEVARALRLPLARVYAVATFYRTFSLVPQGRVLVKVCTGTACHIRGAPQLIDEIERELHIKPGETTPDLAFTVKTVNCVGACAMAPLIIVNDKYHGNSRPAKLKTYLGRGGHSGRGGGDAT
jgi:NADH:ubiquinone oxidoreductase subunit E